MPRRRPRSWFAMLFALILSSPFILSPAHAAPTAEVYYRVSPCRALEILREKSDRESNLLSMGGNGQCITVNNADGGTDPEENPIASTIRATGATTVSTDGSITVNARWDGVMLIPSSTALSLLGTRKFHIDGDPAGQPMAPLHFHPDAPGAMTGKVSGTIHLTARVVYEDGGPESELPLPIDLAVDSRYSLGTVAVNPNLNRNLFYIEPDSCSEPGRADCALYSHRPSTDFTKPPRTIYCYCPDCAHTDGCLNLLEQY